MGLETPSHIREENNLSLKVEGSSLIPKFTSTPLQPTKKKRRYIRKAPGDALPCEHSIFTNLCIKD